MGEVHAFPSPGDVFTDVRGEDRTMRISYHADEAVLVVSLWTAGLCRGSFWLAEGEFGRLTEALASLRSAEDPTDGQDSAEDVPEPRVA